MSDVSQAARVAELERAVKVLVAEYKARVQYGKTMRVIHSSPKDEELLKAHDASREKLWEAMDATEADPIAGPLVRAQ